MEGGLSVVDAVAPSPSDLLRIGGNGVDVVVAADAFGRLWVEHVVGRAMKGER